MEPQLQNWENFRQYHVGNWHGTWKRYSPESELTDSFRSIRSLLLSNDGNEIYHQNHYLYGDGKSESKIFGGIKKPHVSSLFLDHTFSWGSAKVEQNVDGAEVGNLSSNQLKLLPVGFESGFRYESRRVSAGSLYNENGNLLKIFVIVENLGSFSDDPILPSVNQLNSNWAGTLKTITPELTVSAPVKTSWQPLENLGDKYYTLNTQEGVSVSCPRSVELGKGFFLAVDWLINPDLLQRAIRHYDASGFKHFSLEIFDHQS